MLRLFICTVAALLLCVSPGMAEEIKGKIKSIEAHSITVIADGKDVVIQIAKDTKILSPKGEPLKDGLKNPHIKEGTDVIVKTAKKDGKEIASEVKLAPKK